MSFTHNIARWVNDAGLDWLELKTAFEHSIGFSHDAVHVLAGVVLQIGIAAALRSSVSRPLPYLVVLALELLNEANDLRVETWPETGMQIGEGLKDIILTMALPSLLLILTRKRPGLFRRT